MAPDTHDNVTLKMKFAATGRRAGRSTAEVDREEAFLRTIQGEIDGIMRRIQRRMAATTLADRSLAARWARRARRARQRFDMRPRLDWWGRAI